MSRTIAIGDIHGCSRALGALLRVVDPRAEDTVVTLGDCVDRGPNSRAVLDQLLELRQQCHLVPLMGNHELMMLAVLHGELELTRWQQYGGAETLASYQGELSRITSEHREFLANCRDFHENDTHIFMHANYVADVDLCEQPGQVLFWMHLSSMLPPRHHSGKIAVVGHTPQIEGEVVNLGHLICIDTGCFANGWLTALDTTSGRIWQADQGGQVRDGAVCR
ncbi:MAG: metallophosphoesterase family protein [Planctomycetota bacterium]